MKTFKRNTHKAVACFVLAGTLVGCQATNEDVGAVSGTVIGGLIGSRFGKGGGRVAATAAGAMVGMFIGSQIGQSMDARDHRHVNQALENTRTGYTSSWSNPDTGVSYEVEPTRTYERRSRNSTQPCREFTTKAIIGGRPKHIYGTACRMDDGSWKMMS